MPPLLGPTVWLYSVLPWSGVRLAGPSWCNAPAHAMQLASGYIVLELVPCADGCVVL